MALVDIVNNAGGKIGGFGDQLGGEAFITAALLTANTDKVSIWANIKYPIIRQKVIADFAAMQCPFKETLKFADLGDDLEQNDVDIASITVGAGPDYAVTVTTDGVHGRSEDDTVFLADIEGTLVTALNGTTKTIHVIDTTSFTLDETAGTAAWVHTEDTGIISDRPEIGQWSYAFSLPSDYHAMVRHCDESYTVKDGVRKEYQYQTILNRDSDALILLTNDLTNADADSAYIEYVIDQIDTDLFSDALAECIATLLAAELCPILGRDLKTRQQILLEYDQFTVPNAKRFNQSQFNNSAKIVPDYSGGRSQVLRNTGSERNNWGYTAV